MTESTPKDMTYSWVLKLEDEVIKLEADNRHLKAINKELMEALQEIYEMMFDDRCGDIGDIREIARAAIAKALAERPEVRG